MSSAPVRSEATKQDDIPTDMLELIDAIEALPLEHRVGLLLSLIHI